MAGIQRTDTADHGYTDAADYVVWRKGNSNNVDGYATWHENFGMAAGAGSSNSLDGGPIVPEPSQLTLASIGGWVLLTFSTWRRRVFKSGCNR